MSRSTKKGPYVEAGLLKKVNAMLDSGDKQVIKTWSRSSPSSSASHSRYTTAGSTFLCTSPRK